MIKTAQEWIGEENQLGLDIWNKKYRFENETFEEWLDRVSAGNENIRKLILEKKFLFGGRILANRGLHKTGRKVTYSNCFTAGQKVITKRGLINIEDVQVGDYVITHDGSWQKVNNVMSRPYFGDIFEIEAYGLYEKIRCTPNHKFLTKRGWKRADRLLHESEQVHAVDRLALPKVSFKNEYALIDITEGYISDEKKRIQFSDEYAWVEVFCKNKQNEIWQRRGKLVKRYIEHDEEFSYFIGRFLGDGSLTAIRGQRHPSILQIVFNATTEEDACRRCVEIGNKKFGIEAQIRKTNQNTLAVRWNNEVIASWFERNFGRTCTGKYWPNKYVGDLNIALGLLDSDGCIDVHGRVKIVLKNKKLIDSLRDTLFLNGINTLQPRPTGHENTYILEIPTGIAKGRLNDKLTKSYSDARKNLVNNSPDDTDFIKIKSVSILENIDTTVYNLSVENTHSYTVGGVVVHNCYVVAPPEDNIESIFECGSKLARTFSFGGGVGIDISKLAPRGARINNAAKQTTGAVSFMDLYSLITGLIGQSGRRKKKVLASEKIEE